MKKNAHINARLIDLLNVLDARAVVTVYLNGDKRTKIGDYSRPVYEILTAMDDETSEFYKVKGYEVVGVVFDLTNRILIEKGE